MVIQAVEPVLPFVGGAAEGMFRRRRLLPANLKTTIQLMLIIHQDPQDHRQTRTENHRLSIVGFGPTEADLKSGGRVLSAVCRTEVYEW